MNKSNEELESIIKPLLEGSCLKLHSVTHVNYKPHPYMIGTPHLTKSSGIYLNIEEAESKGAKCAHKNCNLSYKEHTSDRIGFVQTIKNCTNEDVQKALLPIVEEIGEKILDGLAFIESEFTITNK